MTRIKTVIRVVAKVLINAVFTLERFTTVTEFTCLGKIFSSVNILYAELFPH